TYRATRAVRTAGRVARGAAVRGMGKHSGRRAFRKTLEELGYANVSEERLNAVFARFKELCDRKTRVTNEDIRALMDDEAGRAAEAYRLRSVQFQSGTNMTPVATVTLETDTGPVTLAAHGDGPVDAVYHAIEAITGLTLELDSYDLRAVGSGKDALGEVTIRVRHDSRIVQGRGLS